MNEAGRRRRSASEVSRAAAINRLFRRGDQAAAILIAGGAGQLGRVVKKNGSVIEWLPSHKHVPPQEDRRMPRPIAIAVAAGTCLAPAGAEANPYAAHVAKYLGGYLLDECLDEV